MAVALESQRPVTDVMVTQPRFVLVTGTAPGEPGVGGVLLRDLLDVAGMENCQCCWLAPRHARQEPYLSDVNTIVQPRRYEVGYRPIRGLIGEWISAATMRMLRPEMIRQACFTVERMVKRFQPGFLLAILESPAAIQVALAVHKRLGIPLRSIVWDDVDLFCRQGMFDRWTRTWIERSFQQALQSSERIAVICEKMQDAYQREHGVESFVIRHGIRLEANSFQASLRQDCQIIGFAGSNTAPDCLESLVQALDQLSWRVNGRDVVLRILGARYLLESRKPQRIEYFGWRSVPETRQRLAECAVLYLPQSFAREARRFSELSFPTKLSTYVAARRPVFLHAPGYASLTDFWQQYELGPLCPDLAVNVVANSIHKALTCSVNQETKWLDTMASVHEQVLSPARFEQGVSQLVS